jgi:uncharacterized protein (DUF1015 family)
MQESYYNASPYNLVRIILGKREGADSASENVYTRAAASFQNWRQTGVLKQDPTPSIYRYSQTFKISGTQTEAERRGFIALGKIEEYSAKVVFRHEQTLAKPKADRLDLLRATQAHFGQIFMLYSGGGKVEAALASAASEQPEIEVADEYGVVHRVWRISDSAAIAGLQEEMRDKQLIIADGHHRYETALAYRNERREAAGASSGVKPGAYDHVMMTFVDMDSPGLVILPTHRAVFGLHETKFDNFATDSRRFFNLERVDCDIDAQRAFGILGQAAQTGTALLAIARDRAYLMHSPKMISSQHFADLSLRQQSLDVVQLHKCLLESCLGISEEAIRNQQNVRYFREAGEALEQLRGGNLQMVFLMNPVRMPQMRDIALAGEVMPQKSTDFYPKLLSGLTIYGLE